VSYEDSDWIDPAEGDLRPILATNLLLGKLVSALGEWSFGRRPRSHTDAEIA